MKKRTLTTRNLVYISSKIMPEDLCTAPRIISLSPLSLPTDVTDVTDATLEESGLGLGTRTGVGDTVTLA